MQKCNHSRFCGILVLVFYTAPAVYGQLYPEPRIYSLHVRSDIQFRFATTLVTSRVANPANYSQETVFEVILPEEAFISNFTLPRDTRTFRVKISVAAFSKSTFNLMYQELLKRVRGAYEHSIFVTPGYPVDDIQISVAIQESRDITTLSVPPIKSLNELLTDEQEVKGNPIAVISRPTKRRAFINYVPGLTDQGSEGLSGKFIVQYDIDRSLDGGDILVVNGYFVHFLAPDVQNAIPKDVLFVLDISSSMEGRKIEQLKDAMYIVLDELKEGDRFNIITFNAVIKSYQPDMIDVTKEDIFNAKEYIRSIKANGGTDINSAILDGIDAVKVAKQEGGRSPIIVFLTDGSPTAGVQNGDQILRNIEHANEGAIPVFSLAFGKDADWALVKKMAVQNSGVGKMIYEDSDANLQISGFYDEFAVTLLNNVSVKYLDDSVDAESLTKSDFKNYFSGSEMVVAGKLTDPNSPVVNLEILSNSVEGDLIITGDKDANFIDVSSVESLKGLTDFQAITEKTWAYLTIKQLLSRTEAETNLTAVGIMKSQAKAISLQEKECSKKKTGGGPTESEEKVIEGLQGKPQLAGIEGGVDTSETVVEDSVNSSFVIPDTVEDSANTCSSSVIPNSRQSLSVENLDNIRVKGKKRKMAADNLLDLEMKMAILEIELTEQRKDQEKKMFEIKKEYQIQQLNREKIIYDLKEQVLRENLKMHLNRIT